MNVQVDENTTKTLLELLVKASDILNAVSSHMTVGDRFTNADLDDMPYQRATIKEASIYCKSAADKLKPIFYKLCEAYSSKGES